MEIYLDNAATTAVSAPVREEMMQVLDSCYGNPSSLHKKGTEAEQLLRLAKERIAQPLKVSDKQIYFTSGGTESNNWAVIGGAAAKARRGRHIITTPFEHPSVSAAMDVLEKQGFEVTRVPVTQEGLVNPESVRAALRADTVLVSVMMVNNELGSRQPVEEIGRLIKAYNSDILFHVDAVQAYGKLPVYPKRWNIDLLSASAHKIHGPKGIGLLYMAENTRILPLIHGGQQQSGMRSGTENMPGIVGFGKAAEEAAAHREAYIERVKALRKRLTEGLLALDGVSINGPAGEEDLAPHIVSVTVRDVRSEVLLHALEEKGIYVSAGSACSSHKREISDSLKAIGLSRELAQSTIRLSLDDSITDEEIDYCIAAFATLLPQLRRFVRK
ncbi:MAG: cysteine desulfurase [Lachnospiraceae bacterium]|nr:cysteine desulfurase [Lachnospiraceae bacterium]